MKNKKKEETKETTVRQTASNKKQMSSYPSFSPAMDAQSDLKGQVLANTENIKKADKNISFLANCYSLYDVGVGYRDTFGDFSYYL